MNTTDWATELLARRRPVQLRLVLEAGVSLTEAGKPPGVGHVPQRPGS